MSFWPIGATARTRALSLAMAILVSLPTMPALGAALLHGQGVLWRLEKAGHPTSYLFGTMHTTDERVLRLPEPVLDAFDASKRCLFELIVPEDGFARTIAEQTLPEGLTLREIVGDEAYNEIVVVAGRYNIPTGKIGRMHPGAILYALQFPPAEWLRRLAGWAFLDLALQNEARALGKPIHALETLEEQLALRADLKPAEIAAVLGGLLANSFRREQEFESLLQVYLRRDLDAYFSLEQRRVALLAEGQRQASQGFFKRLLDDRNEVMVQRMLPHLREAPSFVAIGAGHLPGPKGVLHLLEQRGFRVTRIY